MLLDWQRRFQAREKGPKDLVTEADLESQRVIRDVVLGDFPEHRFVGEEDDSLDASGPMAHDEGASAFCWVVDPLDGTANYVHRFPMFAVSVALCQGNQVIAGTVFDPISNECFNAVRGRGAFLNGDLLRVSDCRELSTALVAASFSANVPPGSAEIQRFVEVLHRSQAVRRIGSAALNLSYLAAGRLDAYWATSVKAWDVAAGVLLVEEAGGFVTGFDGGAFDLDAPKTTAAATPQLHASLVEVLGGIRD